MLHIKVEPEDTPTWDPERSNGRIISEEHGVISEDRDSLPSCLEEQLENGVKKEEASDSSQETESDVVTMDVTIHVEEAQRMAERLENELGVVIKTEDTDPGDEGCNISTICQLKDQLMHPSVHTHEMSGAETSSSGSVTEKSGRSRATNSKLEKTKRNKSKSKRVKTLFKKAKELQDNIDCQVFIYIKDQYNHVRFGGSPEVVRKFKEGTLASEAGKKKEVSL